MWVAFSGMMIFMPSFMKTSHTLVTVAEWQTHTWMLICYYKLICPYKMMKVVKMQGLYRLFITGETDRLLHFWNTCYHVTISVSKCMDKMERDRLVLFMNKLILHRRNVKDILDANGVRILVDLLTLAHLHTSRYSGLWLTSKCCCLYLGHVAVRLFCFQGSGANPEQFDWGWTKYDKGEWERVALQLFRGEERSSQLPGGEAYSNLWNNLYQGVCIAVIEPED